MIVQLPFPATLDDLMKVDGKAELIGGRLVEQMASGYLPSRVAKRIFRRLDDYVEDHCPGEAFFDNFGYALPHELLSGRQSINPDVSYYDGPTPADPMKFLTGAPSFAVEVRSEHDYGRTAERAMADKRADYFEAGTLVVWDVDPVAGTVTKFIAEQAALTFRAGDIADAEPAVPGWRLAVDEVFAVRWP